MYKDVDNSPMQACSIVPRGQEIATCVRSGIVDILFIAN